ncbi:MalY/PatB family protein [Sporolactobacillus sp. THM19-2]|uniref:MalY/PatB family protein n=1 Tax=Sporolactobacillus sp. THM19-2 TaxID=2511171 RepID=UPI00101F8DD9|nr:MalY/PatB family protein [Sporolactobacillus sp. THM19-2]RYL93137.1 pyridoxal phosphate-dependent aminotransferase [Sporolactobacillus sp. THM19-2]
MAKRYDFDEQINRRGSASIKWDGADRIFGGKDLLPMWVADMDFRVPDEVTSALKSRVEHGLYGYMERTDSYLESVREWMKRRHEWQIEKRWICHSPGVVTALNLILDGFTKPGDKILIQPPVYPPFIKAAINQGRGLIENPLVCERGRYHMNFTDLERKMADPSVRLMLLCSPHNPVGRVWSRDELLRVAELAAASHVLVVSDEIHSDLIFKGFHHIPFASLSEEAQQHAIICTAPSKTFNLAGLQVSNIIIPNDQLRKKYMNQIRRFNLSEPNTAGMIAAEAAYRSGSSWLDQCLDYIKRNADYVSTFFREHLPMLSMSPLEGTYLGWIDCHRLRLGKRELQNFMVQKAGLALNPGYTFGEEGAGFVRINLACPHAYVEKAMKQLKRAVDTLKR